MELESLSLRDFRNIAAADFRFCSGVNALIGGNGQGKTNLLEAIALLASGRSIRRAPPESLCRHQTSGFQVHGRTLCQGVRHDIVFQGTPHALAARLNGKALAATSAMGNTLAAVVCTPDSLRLVQGGPLERRRFLDWVVFQQQRRHAMVANDFQKALKARNALLRRTPLNPDELSAWEEQLAILGARITLARRAALQQMRPSLTQYLQALALPGGDYSLELSSQIPPEQTDEASASNLLRTMLRERRERDRALGSTSVGPHRDDLLFTMEGRPLARFGSQGQQKRFVLALKLTEAALLCQLHGEPPLFLLDDPAAELDSDGLRQFLAILRQEKSQLFLTTCRADEIPWSECPTPSAGFTVFAGTFAAMDVSLGIGVL